MKNTMKYMRNKIVVILTVLLFTTGITQAQVFIMDEDLGDNSRIGGSSFVIPPVPYQGADLDEYVPLEEGLLLLAGLGGAYLLKKRKKEKSIVK